MVYKYATKIGAVALAILMMLSALSAVVSAASLNDVFYDQYGVEGYFSPDYPYAEKAYFKRGKNFPIKADQDVGVRVHINGDFSAFAITIPTYGTSKNGVNVSLYKWNGTYDNTVAGTPLMTKQLTNCKDKAHLFEIGRVLPAGEYFMRLHDPIINEPNNGWPIGVYVADHNRVGKSCTYVKGVPNKLDMELIVCFDKEAPAEPFLPVMMFEDIAAYSDSINEANQKYYYIFGRETDVIGQRVNVSAPILGGSLRLATWGNTGIAATVSAYKWQGSFEATVASTPLATKSTESAIDNGAIWVEFSEPQPAGEYLFTVGGADGNQAIAVYQFSGNKSKGYTYVDGAELRQDLMLTVRFASEKNNNEFIQCEGYSNTEAGGTVTVPEKWEPSSDSLLNTHKVQPSTWVFTDGLGRTSLTHADVGDIKDDKTIAMFYWSWHLNLARNSDAFNIQQFIEKYPEAKNNYNHAGWNDGKLYYWNQPLYGYYSVEDRWVLRRHAELLANAGVDAVFTDNTNATMPFRDGYKAMMEAWSEAMHDGAVNSPKISFYLPMEWEPAESAREQLEFLYMDIFRRGLYQNMWFYFDGKPLVAVQDGAAVLNANDSLQKEISQFFNFRANVGEFNDGELRNDVERVGSWAWSNVYPQAKYYATRPDISSGKVEQMTVSAAVNFNYVKRAISAMNGTDITGRSYTTAAPDRYLKEFDSKLQYSKSSYMGYHFAEQFDYAIEVDPKVIFITGWNEWTVSRNDDWGGVQNGFPDQFNDEFSRDIEPTKGALKDYYYYQLVNYTRKFKGAEPIPTPSYKATIDLTAGQEQWAAVEPYFAAYIGNTMNRESYGRVGDKKYVDFSARNDVIGAQIARDDEYVYFNVECNDNITPYTDKLWMNLYIDVDQQNQGWETFDYVVNKTAASEKTSVLEKFTDGYASEKVADVEYTVDGKYMTIKIAKSDLGLTGDDFTINFAWTDNVHDADDLGAYTKDGWIYSQFSGDIMEFYLSGEVAPGARFKFSYISTAENATIPPVGGGDEDTSTDETTPDTEADTTVADTTVADVTTEADTTVAVEDGGCKSSVAMSVIALLTALGAAVVLKKRD